MNFKLKGRQHLKVFVLSSSLLAVVMILLIIQMPWYAMDYKIIDFFFSQAVKQGCGPKASDHPRIIYLVITDDTYQYFGKNHLDRADLARVNNALAQLEPEAAAYDIIFAHPSFPSSDKAFALSLENGGIFYLPVALALSRGPAPFQWENSKAFEKFQQEIAPGRDNKNSQGFLHAKRALMQYTDFSMAARGSGNINIIADPDSVLPAYANDGQG